MSKPAVLLDAVDVAEAITEYLAKRKQNIVPDSLRIIGKDAETAVYLRNFQAIVELVSKDK